MRKTHLNRVLSFGKEHHPADRAIVSNRKPNQPLESLASDWFQEKYLEIYELRNRTNMSDEKFAFNIFEIEFRAFHIAHLTYIEALKLLQSIGADFWGEHGDKASNSAEAFYREAKLTQGSIESATTQIALQFQLAAFVHAGSPVYAPSDGLSQALLHTEFRDLVTDQVRLPHKTIYIHAPDSCNLQVYNDDTKWHDLDGIYITEVSITNKNGVEERIWRVMVVGRHKEIEKSRELNFLSKIEHNNDALLHFKMSLRSGEKIENCIERAELEMMSQQISEAFKKWIPHWRNTFRFILNVLLYATMPDADVETLVIDSETRKLFERIKKLPKGSSKREALKLRLKESDQTTMKILGRSIILDRTYQNQNQEGVDSEDRKLSVQYIRSGHWRNQPYGPKRALIKQQWIKPTWVGSKDNPIKLKNYILKEH